jgi:uncharacterized membrane protein
MPEERAGRLERLISKVEEKELEPIRPPSVWAQTRTLLRNRIIAGTLFMIPILVTIWFVHVFLNSIYARIEPALRPHIVAWGPAEWRNVPPDTVPPGTAYWLVGVGLSVMVVLAILYLVGLITTRTFARRLITLGERLVVRIPFVKFFYKTSKQIVDTFGATTQSTAKKVCVIDFFRTGMKTLAFATGETPMRDSEKPYVNLFVPTTPNPTSGYLVLLPQDQVWEADLSLEEAMTLIVSGGILPPDQLRVRPYGSSTFFKEQDEDQNVLETTAGREANSP